jgi:hypothetical protein
MNPMEIPAACAGIIQKIKENIDVAYEELELINLVKKNMNRCLYFSNILKL